MPSFSDGNTMSDIQGCYLVAVSRKPGDSKIDIHREISEFIERIEDKLARNRNKTRANWFRIALDHARRAQHFFRENNFRSGRDELDLAWEHLERGNKAHQRRTSFIGGSSGDVSPTK